MCVQLHLFNSNASPSERKWTQNYLTKLHCAPYKEIVSGCVWDERWVNCGDVSREHEASTTCNEKLSSFVHFEEVQNSAQIEKNTQTHSQVSALRKDWLVRKWRRHSIKVCILSPRPAAHIPLNYLSVLPRFFLLWCFARWSFTGSFFLPQGSFQWRWNQEKHVFSVSPLVWNCTEKNFCFSPAGYVTPVSWVRFSAFTLYSVSAFQIPGNGHCTKKVQLFAQSSTRIMCLWVGQRNVIKHTHAHSRYCKTRH